MGVNSILSTQIRLYCIVLYVDTFLSVTHFSGVWRSYSWVECRALEASLVAGDEEICFNSLGRAYTVDLTAMQQLNDHTGTARAVQRLAPPPQAAADHVNANANANTAPIGKDNLSERIILDLIEQVKNVIPKKLR